jgi:hypothetical protein
MFMTLASFSMHKLIGFRRFQCIESETSSMVTSRLRLQHRDDAMTKLETRFNYTIKREEKAFLHRHQL